MHAAHENRANDCDKCDETSGRTGSMEKHMRATHGTLADGCDECDENSGKTKGMKKHMQATHKTKVDDDTKILKSILKNPLLENDFEPEVSIDNVVIELNTLFNGCKTRRDHRMISTLRKLTKLQDSQSKKICNECDDKYKGDSELRNHNEEEHLILLSHHNEEGKHIPGGNSDDDDTEFDPLIWDVLLAETDDGKELESDDAKQLTEEEVKEILKLHRYFVHRCGNKLWENLLQPAGRFKGKKRLILEFLVMCAENSRKPHRDRRLGCQK